MSKPRVNRVSLTKHNCLARADNTSPFRWMGVWCAVHAPCFQEKAEWRAERSRARRGSKKRGIGHIMRRKVERARARALPKASEVDPPVAIQRSMRRLSRIDKMDKRFDDLLQRWVVKFNELDATVKSIRSYCATLLFPTDELGRRLTPRPVSRGLQVKGLRTWSRFNRLRESIYKVSMGHWGLPRDLTRRRLEMVGKNELLGRALPRISDEWWLSRSASARRQPLPVIHEIDPCRCRGCRLSSICPDGHGVGPGERNCRFCSFVRHPKRTAGKSNSGYRRGERKHTRGSPPRRA